MNCSSVLALLSFSPRPRSLFLAALTCAIPALADTVVIRGDRVNIRSQPSLDGEVLVWMKRGETLGPDVSMLKIWATETFAALSELVLEAARKIDAGDTKRKADIDAGTSVADLITKKYK